MADKRSLGWVLLVCVLSIAWLIGTAEVATAADDFPDAAENYKLMGEGALDTPFSKLAPWPDTDGDVFYSGCYAPERCFVTVSIKNPTKPKVLAKVYTFDPEKSVPPIDANPVWTNNALYGGLTIKAPCGDWVGVNQETLTSAELEAKATCWDPGWNTHSHFVAYPDWNTAPDIGPGCGPLLKKKVLVVNMERWRGGPPGASSKRANYHGLKFYDVSDPRNPVFLSYWEAPADAFQPAGPNETWGGTHHFFFDGRYVYTGAYYQGFVNRIFVIVDVKDPYHPVEAGKLWIPGQGTTPAELAARDWIPQSVFSPIVYSGGKLKKGVGVHWTQVVGDTAIVSWHQAGLVLANVSDKTNPTFISRLDYLTPEFMANEPGLGPSPDYQTCQQQNGNPATGAACGNTHSAKLIPGTKFIWVTDEYFICPYGHGRVVDASDPYNMKLISHFLLPENTDCTKTYTRRTPSTHLGNMRDGILHLAWYGAGVRAIDLRDPYHPKFKGFFTYNDTGGGAETYDVIFGPKDGFMYASDSFEGVRVLKYKGK